jgi:hypothetical protein
MRNPPVLDAAAKQHQIVKSGSANATALVMKQRFVTCRELRSLGFKHWLLPLWQHMFR